LYKTNHCQVVAIILLIITLYSCNDDVGVKPESVNLKGERVFMINEGNFQWGNATLSAYSPDSNVFADHLFMNANNIPIGDVFQSMILHQSSYFLCLNNSGKIIQIDSATLKIQRTFTGFKSPRFMLGVSPKQIMVSDLYSNTVSVLNIQSGAIETTIDIKGWTEHMIEIDNEIWVGNRTNDKIYIIDKTTLSLTDSMTLAHQGTSMILDAEGNLWVLCQGDAVKKIAGALICIEPILKKVLKKFDFSETDYPFNLCANHQKDSLYYLNEHLYVLPISASDLPVTEYVNMEGSTPYGLGIEPSSSKIYFSDAKDFVKPSLISIFNAKGDELLSSFEGGILCNGFLFPEKK
jgi:DNA-binding beta-propeller fold protein YncE